MSQIRELIWDEVNIPHIARHDVTRDEVEEVAVGKPVTWNTYGGRIMVVGSTRKGRMLSVVLAPKEQGSYYPVTARVADRKERRRYEELKGGDDT